MGVPPLQALRELGKELHQLLIAGDVIAPARIAESFMPLVLARVKRCFPSLGDPHLVDTAVEDALISYFGRPAQYQPDKGNLLAYLTMSAIGDLKNMLRKHERESSDAQGVELGDRPAEHPMEMYGDVASEDEAVLEPAPVWNHLMGLLPDAKDRELLALLIEGERSTGKFAAVLGVSDLPPKQAAAIVKRHKDRIKKRITRHIAREEIRDE